ncbi:MAG: threonine ammonia-lyase [Micromonosporaceae bacterium]
MTDDGTLDVDGINADALAAAGGVAPYLRRTAVEYSAAASHTVGAEVWLKHEQQQVTGSFKPRGSLTKLTAMTQPERVRGVVAPSAGNHGLGTAYAAARMGATARIYLPEQTDPIKLTALSNLGARVSMFEDIETARLAALFDADKHGWAYASAYNDRHMVIGAAMLGGELAEELPDFDVLLVPIGGGGLAAGIAVALAGLRTQVWAVATEESPTWINWLKAGHAGDVTLAPSIAEGLSGPIEPNTLTFPLVRDLVPRVLGVDDAQIGHAVAWLAATHQQIVEPSGAAALAAALSAPEELAGARVGVILTGRNIGFDRYRALLARHPTPTA